jgi:hypothetical protein
MKKQVKKAEKDKKFRVMVTERYFVTHIIDVTAENESEAQDIAEGVASSKEVCGSDLEHDETESYIMSDLQAKDKKYKPGKFKLANLAI